MRLRAILSESLNLGRGKSVFVDEHFVDSSSSQISIMVGKSNEMTYVPANIAGFAFFVGGWGIEDALPVLDGSPCSANHHAN